jgi:NodT family efflux transporter outer membrane factor (OMF) lipoprotein
MARRNGYGGDRPKWQGCILLRWIALAVLLGTVGLISGCVTTGPLQYVRNGFKVGPNYSTPPAPVASEWIEANDPRVQKDHLSDWWQVFEDPVLNHLLTMAYGQNLTLRVAATRILEARAQRSIAVGELFPQTQQLTGQYSQTGNSRNIANNPTNLVFPGGANPFTNWFSNWQTSLTASWELDFWGRFRRSIESTDANLDVAVANFDDALVTLLADVATNYVQYRVAQQRIAIARSNVEIQEKTVALIEDQLKGGLGKTTKLDLEQARTVLEQTRSTIPPLQASLGQANDNLCILLGMPPAELQAKLGAAPAAGTPPMAHTPTSVAADIPANLLRQRPDIRSAERQVAAQSALIGVAEADLYPTIFINGTLGWSAQDLSKLFESASFFGNITPNFKWNILNYGRLLHNVRLQQLKTDELIASYQNKVLNGAREVQTNLRNFLRSQEQARALGRSAKAAEEAVKLGLAQYKGGTVPFNTVYNLQTAQVQQQDQLAVVEGNVALNLISVYRALGGGWEWRPEKENGQQTVGQPKNCSEGVVISTWTLRD